MAINKITLLDTTTGKAVVYEDDMGDACANDWYENGGRYIWTEGNYGCDCNRMLFFCRASGVDDPEDRPCGHTRFRVLCIEFPDGDSEGIEDDPR